MYNKSILILLLFICTACLDERSSPDNSADPTSTPVPETSSDVKDSNKNNEGHTVADIEACLFYPTKHTQPNWNRYFETKSSLLKDSLIAEPFYLNVRNGNQKRKFSLIFGKVTWLSAQGFSWIEKIESIPAHSFDSCNYPEVSRIQVSNDSIIFVIGEWRTSKFYQPMHIVFLSDNMPSFWVDEFTGSKFIDVSLYREILSDEEQKIFLRRRYGNYPLSTTSSSDNLNSISDMQLMMTNRTNAYIGSFVLKYKDGAISSQLGPIEAFKFWSKKTSSYKHIIEFGAAAPTFVGDIDNTRTTKAAGNFDRDSTRIRLIFDQKGVNGDLPFTGEYIQQGFEQKWIHFTGVRPARPETFE